MTVLGYTPFEQNEFDEFTFPNTHSYAFRKTLLIPRSQSSSTKKPTQHASSKSSRYASRVQSTRSQIRRLTEFITPRESQRVGDGQSNSNNYHQIALALDSILPINSKTKLTNQTQPVRLDPHQRRNS